MIHDFTVQLLAPLYKLVGLSIPIFVTAIIAIIFFLFITNIKMHISRKSKGRHANTYMPYFSDEEIDYVLGKKK